MQISSTAAHAPVRDWAAALSARGLTVLPASYLVPVELWLRRDDHVLHLRARGTTVTLRRYPGDALGGLLLRSECDCEEHRTAGAAARTTLLPGIAPLAEAVYDGATEQGWTGYQAGLLDVHGAIPILERLLAELDDAAVTRVA